MTPEQADKIHKVIDIGATGRGSMRKDCVLGSLVRATGGSISLGVPTNDQSEQLFTYYGLDQAKQDYLMDVNDFHGGIGKRREALHALVRSWQPERLGAHTIGFWWLVEEDKQKAEALAKRAAREVAPLGEQVVQALSEEEVKV